MLCPLYIVYMCIVRQGKASEDPERDRQDNPVVVMPVSLLPCLHIEFMSTNSLIKYNSGWPRRGNTTGVMWREIYQESVSQNVAHTGSLAGNVL